MIKNLSSVCVLFMSAIMSQGVFADMGNDSELKYFRDSSPIRSYSDKPISPRYAYDVTAHSNCVLENSKGSQSPLQANRISQACRHKATPKRCREVSAIPPDSNSKSPQEICVDKCKSENLYSRQFGECSLDM